MTTCPEGHPVPDGQHFCGDCGTRVVVSCPHGHENPYDNQFCFDCGEPFGGDLHPDPPQDASSSPRLDDEVADRDSATVVLEADSGQAATPAEQVANRPAAEETYSTELGEKERALRRPAVLVTAAVGFLFIVALLFAAAQGGDDDTRASEDDSDPDRASESQPVETVDPHLAAVGVCFDDLNGILMIATTDATTNEVSYNIIRVYGTQDERTQALLQENARFQSEVYQVGLDQANIQSSDRLYAWCENWPGTDSTYG